MHARAGLPGGAQVSELKKKKLTEPAADAAGVSPISGMGKRISECADRVGGRRALARSAGVHESRIYAYIKEENEPGIEPLVRIASAAGVSVDWIATGVEQGAHVVEDSVESPLNEHLFEQIFLALEGTLAEHGLTMDPKSKARFVLVLYDKFGQWDGQVDRRFIETVVLSNARPAPEETEIEAVSEPDDTSKFRVFEDRDAPRDLTPDTPSPSRRRSRK